MPDAMDNVKTIWEQHREALAMIAVLIRENEHLNGIVDILTGPPLTTEEAEKELDNLPELDEAEKAAMASIDINAIIRYATDPKNASPEWMVGQMVKAAKSGAGIPEELVAQAERWLEGRFT